MKFGKMLEKTKNSTIFQILAILAIILTINILADFIPYKDNAQGTISGIQYVSAKEIYPMFVCPCCGNTLNPNAICCGLAQERISFIDDMVKQKTTKEKAILEYIKRYGLNSFADKKKEEEFKKKLAAQAPKTRPIISISPPSHNLGDVFQSKGVAVTFFTIKNKGAADLIINKLETSCGCTSASIVYQGKEGPKFNMPGHGINEKIKNWQITIPPNSTAQLKVYYDPNFHKNFKGPATRIVSIFSNDPVEPQKQVEIELNQIPE